MEVGPLALFTAIAVSGALSVLLVGKTDRRDILVITLCGIVGYFLRPDGWAANSRVRPLAADTLSIMRDAGCWLVAFGFESGSQETLDRIKKGAAVEENLRAAELAREAGLKLYGFYLIGLPWEDRSQLEATRRHILAVDADFIEVHIAVPYYGTELYRLAEEAGLIDGSVIGQDYFDGAMTGTVHPGG
jgi:anaerobic magnesium-protoporphyrin IX monomethyl ester cyclase